MNKLTKQQEVDKANTDIRRAAEAETVLNNPIFKESLDLIRAKLMTDFERTKFGQSDERDEVWRKMQTVNWFEEHFKQVLKTGKMAKQTLSLLDKAKNMIR